MVYETSFLLKLMLIFFAGKLEVRLMGCQDLLETVPGRCRVTSLSLTSGSPGDAKSSLKARIGRSGSGRHLKMDELSGAY